MFQCLLSLSTHPLWWHFLVIGYRTIHTCHFSITNYYSKCLFPCTRNYCFHSRWSSPNHIFPMSMLPALFINCLTYMLWISMIFTYFVELRDDKLGLVLQKNQIHHQVKVSAWNSEIPIYNSHKHHPKTWIVHNHSPIWQRKLKPWGEVLMLKLTIHWVLYVSYLSFLSHPLI